MEALKELYHEFFNNYDFCYKPGTENPGEMLYTLETIKIEIELEEDTENAGKLENIINKFKAAGVQPQPGPDFLKRSLLKLYNDLNPDYLNPMQEHIFDCLQSNLTINQLINDYCDLCPTNDGLLKSVIYLQHTKSISDLETFYEIIDYLYDKL